MKVPKYRIRRDRDQAYVEMDGRRIPLPGRARSPESRDAYRRALGDYLRRHASGDKPKPLRLSWELSVAELVAAWLDHCRLYYGGANTRSNEYDNCRYAVRPLVALFGDVAVVDFRAEELRAVREAMITGQWQIDTAKQPVRAWSRKHANAQVNKIKRLFRWGLERGLVPSENAVMLAAVPPLKKGRTRAREPMPVAPVPDATIDATLPHLPAVVQAMVKVHRITGMRSDNLCAMRPCDIDPLLRCGVCPWLPTLVDIAPPCAVQGKKPRPRPLSGGIREVPAPRARAAGDLCAHCLRRGRGGARGRPADVPGPGDPRA